MKLNVDDNHKMVNLSELDLSKTKKVGVKIGTTTLTLLMLSGCNKKIDNDYADNRTEVMQEVVFDEKLYSIVEHRDDDLIDFSLEGLSFVGFDGVYLYEDDIKTYGDLKKVKEIMIFNKDNVNCDVLNYLPNVQKIVLCEMTKVGTKYNNVDGSRLPSNLEIEVEFYENSSCKFNEDRYEFLKDIPDIKKLRLQKEIYYCNYDSDFVQSLKNVHNLEIGLYYFSSFKYKDFNYLDSLTIYSNPYDVPLFFSNDEIDGLQANGVDVKILNKSEADILKESREVNDQISKIVDQLDIDENSTQQDKLNAVLTYVLCNCSYDEEVSNNIRNGVDTENEMLESFYKQGFLTGNFLGDTQICGNYAALTSALCKRVGIESFELISSNHTWNAVKLGDYYYYVDPTWLDGVKTYEIVENEKVPGTSIISLLPVDDYEYYEDYFKNNDKEKIATLSWYLVDPTEVDEIQTNQLESHDAVYIPLDMEIKDIPESIEKEAKEGRLVNKEEVTTEELTTEVTTEEIKDISDKKFVVDYNGLKVVVGALAFIGILTTFGMSTIMHQAKKESLAKELEEMLNHTRNEDKSDDDEKVR